LIFGIDELFKYQPERKHKTMIKKNILLAVFMILGLTAIAQVKTTSVTLYKEFKPSVITLMNGKTIKQSLTNVSLKNSSLLYLNGEYTMEANMETIATVQFDDRKYYNIHNQLGFVVDSVGSNVLYRIDLIDMVAYNQQLRNNINVSNMGFENGGITTSSMDLNNDEDYKLPIFSHYYYLYNGELIKVHEREVSRNLPKDKEVKRKYRTIIGLDTFSWSDEASLIQLLKAISSNNQ
jgi:hypothetical protein